jgi:hypothetical protein
MTAPGFGAVWRPGAAGKQFFFEKKNQKTFGTRWVLRLP